MVGKSGWIWYHPGSTITTIERGWVIVILLLVVIGTAMLVLLLIIFELESEVSRLQSLAEFATGIIDALLAQTNELSSKVADLELKLRQYEEQEENE